MGWEAQLQYLAEQVSAALPLDKRLPMVRQSCCCVEYEALEPAHMSAQGLPHGRREYACVGADDSDMMLTPNRSRV